jgi:hypothetical protein
MHVLAPCRQGRRRPRLCAWQPAAAQVKTYGRGLCDRFAARSTAQSSRETCRRRPAGARSSAVGELPLGSGIQHLAEEQEGHLSLLGDSSAAVLGRYLPPGQQAMPWREPLCADDLDRRSVVAFRQLYRLLERTVGNAAAQPA